MRTAFIMAASSFAAAAAMSSTACKSSLTLGGQSLQTLVINAARHDVTSTVDLKGIVWLEHLNLVVGSKTLAETFYFDFLGMTKDPDARFHANLGQQQFHLAETGDTAQRITGSIGIVVPTLDTLRKRIPEVAESLKDTQFAIIEDVEGCITISCPWGNRMHLYAVEDDSKGGPISDSPHKMVKLHAGGGAYAADRMAVRGKPGIRYVEISCRKGTTKAIGSFYKEILGCTVSTPATGQVAICVGPNVHLIFIENNDFSHDDANAMEGVHLCIYVNDFEGLYQRLEKRQLVWTNPRFLHLDSCDTWSEALASRTLRFKDIIDLETGEKLLELEHETRPMRHGQFLKVPFYEAR